MDTFSGRLRAAMLAAGVNKASELAKIAGISETMARRWMGMRRATMAADRLALVAQRLRVRMVWLSTGDGIPFVPGSLIPSDSVALTMAAAMDEEKFRRWVECGEKIAAKP